MIFMTKQETTKTKSELSRKAMQVFKEDSKAYNVKTVKKIDASFALQGLNLLITTDSVKHSRIKSNAIKT